MASYSPLTVVFQLFVCFQDFTLEYQPLFVQWYALSLWKQTSFNIGTTTRILCPASLVPRLCVYQALFLPPPHKSLGTRLLSSLPPKYAKPRKQLQETSIGIVSFQRKDPSDLINLLDFTISRVCLAMHFFSFVYFFVFPFYSLSSNSPSFQLSFLSIPGQ